MRCMNIFVRNKICDFLQLHLDMTMKMCYNIFRFADVAESADAHDSGSCGATRAGSSPVIRTITRVLIGFNDFYENSRFLCLYLPNNEQSCLAQKLQRFALFHNLEYTY